MVATRYLTTAYQLDSKLHQIKFEEKAPRVLATKFARLAQKVVIIKELADT
jgi:hypothetical protein